MIFSREKLFALKKALLNLGSVSTEDGTTLVYDNEVLEVGNEVFVDGEDGLQPAPDKDYVYDTRVISVEGGIVTAITEKPVEQETVETPEEEVTEETTEEKTETTEEETTEEPTEEVTEEEVPEEPVEEEIPEETTEEEIPEEPTVDELKAVIDEQKAVIEDLKAQIEELKAKLEEPAAEPAEEEFKNQKPTTETSKIDFSRYIKKKTNKNI